jgi:hypothetical protein
MCEVGVDVPFLSILTPYKGTALWNDLEAQDRLSPVRGWQFYNGYNVAFQPGAMTPEELLQAHRRLWKRAFSPRYVLKRLTHSAVHLRLGALLLSLAMNGFYGLKALRGNLPVEMQVEAQPEWAPAFELPGEWMVPFGISNQALSTSLEEREGPR